SRRAWGLPTRSLPAQTELPVLLLQNQIVARRLLVGEHLQRHRLLLDHYRQGALAFVLHGELVGAELVGHAGIQEDWGAFAPLGGAGDHHRHASGERLPVHLDVTEDAASMDDGGAEQDEEENEGNQDWLAHGMLLFRGMRRREW